MGQQQLLLLVLGIVIVGLAVVVGIQAFDSGAQQAEADALTMDAMGIVNAAKAWKEKPAAFGGGGDETDWSNFTHADISLAATHTTANTNASGCTSDVSTPANLVVTCVGTDKTATTTFVFATELISTVISDT